MTTYLHKDTDFIERMERINITDYVQTFLMGLKKKYGTVLKISYLDGAEHFKKILNAPENKVCSPLESLNGFYYWNGQKVDILPSNLGYKKGYIFYFICTSCDQRVKYIFKYKTYDLPMCRTCCGLKYVPQSRRQTRNLSRLIRKSYLSSEAKWAIIKYAGITREDIPDASI